MPIIIPTGILSAGIPGYTIVKNQKKLSKKRNKENIVIVSEEQQVEEKKVEKEKTKNMQNKNRETYIQTDYQDFQTKQEKTKVKTKGTIY